jgi:xanthosine phosphorylase
MTGQAHDAAAVVAEAAAGVTPELGLVLGSGLARVAGAVESPVRIPYSKLPGFTSATVPGHASELLVGRLGGHVVACLSGRSHVYEGVSQQAIATPIRTLALLGIKVLLLTNASGSLRREVGPGSLVALTDHINLLGFNPLTGPNDDAFGPRFPSLGEAYDREVRARLHAAATAVGTPLHEGVYLATPGPSFETPAEIRAFRTLGADLVGMSTVPEVIVARHAGLRVGAVSVVTNLAEGLGSEALTHEHTLRAGERGAAALAPVIERWVRDG